MHSSRNQTKFNHMKRKTFSNFPFLLTGVQLQTNCTYDDFLSFCAQNIPDFNKWCIARSMGATNDTYFESVGDELKAIYLYKFRSKSIFKVIEQQKEY